MDQRANIGVFEQPQRAIRGFGNIADAFSNLPAFSSFGTALSIKDDARE